VQEAHQNLARSAHTAAIELTSPYPGGGKTHLLYDLIALNVLPKYLNGRQSCVAIFDSDGAFDVVRLVQQFRQRLPLQLPENTDTGAAIETALQHVHIFRPQSLASLTATIENLPAYLLHTSHPSSDRALSFIALDSASAFYWQARAAEEDYTYRNTTGSSSPSQAPLEEPASYAQVTTALKTAAKALNAPVVLTSWSLHAPPTQQHNHGPPRSLRPSLPAPLSALPTARFVVQRIPVRRLPAHISVREALREAGDRQRAVDEGKFERVVNQWGLDPRTLERVRAAGEGFGFRITVAGLAIEREGTEDS